MNTISYHVSLTALMEEDTGSVDFGLEVQEMELLAKSISTVTKAKLSELNGKEMDKTKV